MPHCPRCSKAFESAYSVTRHLSQPRSLCARVNGHDGGLMTQACQSHPTSTRESEPVAVNEELEDSDLSRIDPQYLEDTYEMDTGIDLDDLSIRNSTPVREDYLGAACTHGSGTSFMNDFDLDRFSDLRKTNLYYPFASRQDWQLGFFLLSSGMSMARIDQFLRLEWVCNLLPVVPTAGELQFRYSNYHYHFNLLKIPKALVDKSHQIVPQNFGWDGPGIHKEH